MEYIHIKQGNLLDATEDYIAHQCNCVSHNAHALAKQLFDRYPYADTYKKRINHNQPGTIDVFYQQPHIINMYAQYYPGTSKYTNDSSEKRLLWFQQCLEHISHLKNIKTVA